MKKLITLFLSMTRIFMLTACSNDEPAASNDQQQNTSNKDTSGDEKILIAYFTRADNLDGQPSDASSRASLTPSGSEYLGNVENIANFIHDKVGGELFSIISEQPYSTEYEENVDVAEQQQDNNERPALANQLDNIDDYDVIFIGYPNWWGTMPMPVFTFLEEYDLSDKTIIPFTTHRGSTYGSSLSDLENLYPNATILEGIAIRGEDAPDSQADVNNWLSEIGY